ncbi:MAG: RNA polymerase sigma factor [Myxococcota bacterium]
MSERAREDWSSLLWQLDGGDRRALLKLTRLINGFLTRWNAYDFRDEWEDLIQDVLMAALRAQREGRIREREYTYGFLKTIARNKFVDRLKAHLRAPAESAVPWEEVMEGEATGELAPASDGAPERDQDLGRALGRLEARRRRCVEAVYLEGHTLDEAAVATGIPLGSLRRYLREGLAELQSILGEATSARGAPGGLAPGMRAAGALEAGDP